MQRKISDALDTIVTIFFDLDNTLIERDKAFRSMLPNWLTKHAPAVDAAEYEIQIGKICNYDNSGFTDRADVAEWMRTTYNLQHLTVGDIVAEMAASTAVCATKQQQVIEMLMMLKEHYALGVISNGGSRNQRSKLERTGLTPIFDSNRIYIEGERLLAKPNPAFFELVCREQGIPANQILFVGDHPINDMHGAAAAGMNTWWISNGRSLSDYMITPDGISETIEDFFQQILIAHV